MTAYVVHVWTPFLLLVRLAGGHANLVFGPRVWEVAGCAVGSCTQCFSTHKRAQGTLLWLVQL